MIETHGSVGFTNHLIPRLASGGMATFGGSPLIAGVISDGVWSFFIGGFAVGSGVLEAGICAEAGAFLAGGGFVGIFIFCFD
jgi:hypothetical protein